ncbi:MAG: hypothetical protein ABI867_45270 [Kofleriaceae bacterium]
MTDPWVCLECGVRQGAKGPCRRCGCEDDTLDLMDLKVRELMRDVEDRLLHQREKRLRLLGVAVGMVVVFALWLVPGYWAIEESFRLPMFFDQWILMAGIGLATMAILSRMFTKRRFPYLSDDLAVR